MNPELRRNLWLEITPQRLLAMPAILLLIFAGAWLLDGHALSTFTSSAAIIAYLLIAVIWGARLSAASLSEELEQGTWDGQRVSGLSAQAMVWGKLLGGAAFTWYGGLLCLLVYVWASWHTLGAGVLSLVLVILLSLALAVLALSLLSSLALWRKQRTPSMRQTRAVYGLLLLLLFFIHGFSALKNLASGHIAPVIWYDHMLPGLPFYALSSLVFAGWSVFGAQRLMRAELQYRNGPLAWVLFLLFLTLYAGGWLYSGTPDSRLPLIGFKLSPQLLQLALGGVLCASLVYLTVLYEPKDWLRLRRLSQLWQHNRRRALQDLPLWISTLGLTVLFAVGFCALALLQLPLSESIAVLAGTANLLCFLLRDLLLILWLNGTPTPPRRADSAAVLYLAVLYLLLPALLLVAHLTVLDGLFNPMAAYSQPVWLAAGVFELAAMLDLTRRRRRALRLAQAIS